MATRSFVAIVNRDGSVSSSRIHNDGYPSGVGKVLLDYYDTSAAGWLIARGNYSSLRTTVMESEPIRGNGGFYNVHDVTLSAFVERFNQSDADYAYIRKNRTWYVLLAGCLVRVKDVLAGQISR